MATTGSNNDSRSTNRKGHMIAVLLVRIAITKRRGRTIRMRATMINHNNIDRNFRTLGMMLGARTLQGQTGNTPLHSSKKFEAKGTDPNRLSQGPKLVLLSQL